jgi:hypothetical protein
MWVFNSIYNAVTEKEKRTGWGDAYRKAERGCVPVSAAARRWTFMQPFKLKGCPAMESYGSDGPETAGL